MRGEEVPSEILRNTIRTYGDLHKKFDNLLDGKTNSSILVLARPGVGKSHYLKLNANPEVTLFLEGNLRPYMTYVELHENPHKLIILDDAETLWQEKPGRILVRQITETAHTKTIRWISSANPKFDVPCSFQTNSKVLIICNRFRFGDTDETKAILDRCLCNYFDPSNEEVARYVANWFWDQEVLDYAMKNLLEIDRLSARMFVKASERREHQDSGWENEFPRLSMLDSIVREIYLDTRFERSEERIVEFRRRSAEIPDRDGEPMSRATYMRHQADLKARGQLELQSPLKGLKAIGKRTKPLLGVEAIKADIERAARERDSNNGDTQK